MYVFVCPTAVTNSEKYTYTRFKQKKNNAPMIQHLFEDDDQLDDLTRQLLRTYGSAMRLRLEAKQGGAAEFLVGGRLHPDNISNEDKELMEVTPSTSDCIESFFGILDMTTRTQSKNLSFHSASTLATWVSNHTSEWLSKLTPPQRQLLVNQSRRRGRSLKRAADKREAESADYRLKMMMEAARLERTRMKTKIHAYLQLSEVALIKTPVEFENSIKGMSKAQVCICHAPNTHTHTHGHTLTCMYKHQVTKFIKVQIRALTNLCGNKKTDLITFSASGKQFSHDVIRATYVALLRRLPTHAFIKKSLVTMLIKETHVFRGSEMYNRTGAKDRKAALRDLIEECEQERTKMKAAKENDTAVGPTGRPLRRRSRRLIPLDGRSVEVPATRWGGEHDETYAGTVKKTANGFEVRWHTGEITEEKYENLAPYLVEDGPVGIAEFVTSEWRIHSKIIIEEDDIDQLVTLYTRVGKVERVCLEFSGGVYEGLGQSVYTMRDGILRDEDDDEIKYRSSDKTSKTPGYVTLSKYMVAVDTASNNPRSPLLVTRVGRSVITCLKTW